MPPEAVHPVWTAHLSDPAVRAAFAAAHRITRAHAVTTTPSTQDVARHLAHDGAADGVLVVTDVQTAGRGRHQKRWDDDPAGGTLALSVLLDATVPAPELLPHALGMAVIAACHAAVPTLPDLRLKWPNDVVRRDHDDTLQKLSGTLVEREQVQGPHGVRDVLLCGVGINVALPDALDAPDRVCLSALAHEPPDRPRLLAALVTALDTHLDLLHRPDALLRQYRTSSDTLDRPVEVLRAGHPPLEGTATAIDDGGRLVVTNDTGTYVILSGTVRDPAATIEGTA